MAGLCLNSLHMVPEVQGCVLVFVLGLVQLYFLFIGYLNRAIGGN